MKFNIIYQNNETGKKLLEQLKSHWDDVNWYDFNIGDNNYFNIMVENKAKYHRIINNPTAIKRCASNENFLGIMRANHITCGPEDKETAKIYEVLIFDMKIIFIRQKVAGKGGVKTKYMRENQKARVAEISKRALLLSGLDLAVVKLELNSRKRLQVTGINPCPKLRDKDISVLIEELDKLCNWQKKEVKLGADPEFMIINNRNGKLVSASQFFPSQGMVGCDNIRLPNRQQRPVAEIRPKPDKSPLQLVENIKYALTRASSMAPYQNVKWVAGSQPVPGYSIGGHIHFSNLELNAAILRALDNYIGLIVFMIENPHTAVKRRKKYGYLGDYREKDYGGYEYRTPGSWLVSQKITTAVICLAKIVASNYLQLETNYLNLPEAQEAFYSGDKNYFMKDFPLMWRELENTELYEKYAQELEILRWMIDNDIQWDERMDFRKGWKITTGSKRKNSRTALQNSRQIPGTVENIPINTGASTSRNRSTERRSANRSRTSRNPSRNVPNLDNITRNTVVIQNPANIASRRGQSDLQGRIVNSAGVRRAIMVS